MRRLGKKKTILILSALALIVFTMIFGICKLYSNSNKPIMLTYEDFLKRVEKQQVKKLFLSDDANLKGEFKNGEIFETDNPRSNNLKEVLLLQGVQVEEIGDSKSLGQLAIFIIIMVGFAAFIYFLSKQSSKQASREYNQMSSIDFATEKDSDISFANIAGNEEAKDSIMELVDFLENPMKYQRYGARMPRGVILYGPPGTGKTLMARALAKEAGVDYMAVSGSDFVQVYAGLGAGRIRNLFKRAREIGKCVIFIDEIDAIGKKRASGGLGGSDESDRTLNALLTEMSGFKGNEGVIVLAATNRLDILDEALLRPGRFDRQIEVGLPDLKARKDILELYTRDRPISRDISIENLAYQTVYFSGAKLENLMNEAAIYAARDNAPTILDHHIDRAFYTIIAGEEKRDRSSIREIDRKVTAYHEAGHAIATKLLCPQNKVSKVTIIPSVRGAGGFSMNIPPDRMYHSKRDIFNSIKIALAGRVVEEIIFGRDNITTGASNDIEKATELIMAMVRKFGMIDELGMINYDILLGDANKSDKRLIDISNKIMMELYDETRQLMEAYIGLVRETAKMLMEKETLEESDIDALANKYGVGLSA